jgi:hypothetical protein
VRRRRATAAPEPTPISTSTPAAPIPASPQSNAACALGCWTAGALKAPAGWFATGADDSANAMGRSRSGSVTRAARRPTGSTTRGQDFSHGIRLYRPLDVDQTRRHIEGLRSHPITPAGI